MTLQSERLLFRPHIPEDKEAYCAMEMDAEVRRYVGGYPRSREDAEKRFESTLLPNANRLRVWATVLKSTGEYIGRSGVYPHMNANSVVIQNEGALSYYIAKQHWNRGYATEAGQMFVSFGFDELQLTRIVTTIELGNDASIHIIKKLGFKLDYLEEGQRSFCHFSLENGDKNKS